MRKTEYQHNTAEQVREYIEAALALVDELGPPEDLRVPAFVKACDLYSAKQLFYEQAVAGGIDLNQLRR